MVILNCKKYNPVSQRTCKKSDYELVKRAKFLSMNKVQVMFIYIKRNRFRIKKTLRQNEGAKK